MKISTKGRYGLTVMMELAREFGSGPISLKTIAARHNLSEHYLEQLVPPLRNTGLITSVRGAYGGYRLQEHPETITVGEIIRTLEGPISPVDDPEEDAPAQQYLWQKITDSINEVLDGITLQQLIEYEDPKNHMYYI